MKRHIHILAAEGGKDSELFVQDLANAFSKLAYNMNWSVDWISNSKNVVLEISGADLTALDEQSGGFRIQRIPPTERKNRTHTSTVTVAIMKTEITLHSQYDMIDESYFKVEWFSGTGAGGQFRNKHQNSCRVIHIPTGISEARQSRSRDSNLINAMEAIKKTLQQKKQEAIHGLNSQEKKDKLGSGQRGDKLITIQFQNDKVTHHKTGKICRVKDFMNGKMNLIW